MESLHGLLDGRIVIEAVALEQVDIVELEALQAGLDGGEYILVSRLAFSSIWEGMGKAYLATESILIDVPRVLRRRSGGIKVHLVHLFRGRGITLVQ